MVSPRVLRVLRVALATLLVGVAVTGVVLFVAARLVSPSRETPATPPVSTIVEGCDFGPVGEPCPDEGLVDDPTFEGAVERFRQGISAPEDARFLLLTPADYDTSLRPVFGPGSSRPGHVPLSVPAWEASYGDIERLETFSWEQSWDLVGGSVMFEHVFVLGSAEDALGFLANHAGFMDGLGVEPAVHPSSGTGAPGEMPLVFRFIDADTVDPARRCVSRALAATDRMVFAVTLLTGGDCRTPDPSVPSGVTFLLRARAEEVLG